VHEVNDGLDRTFTICEHVGVATKLKPTAEREPTRVSRLIQQVMEAKDWDYRELADRLGVPLSLAHAWATGGHEPTLGSLPLIPKKLKLDLAEVHP